MISASVEPLVEAREPNSVVLSDMAHKSKQAAMELLALDSTTLLLVFLEEPLKMPLQQRSPRCYRAVT